MRVNSKKLQVIILSCVITLGADIQGHANDRIKILFIGSSYIATNNLPLLFFNLTSAGGKEIYYDDERVISGQYLDYHAHSSETAMKIEEMNWDYVVLQGAGPNLAYPDDYPYHPVPSSLALLEQKIHANNPGTKIIYMMPWAFEDGMTWVAGWTDDFFDMQQIIYNKTLDLAAEVDIIIAPVGWAYNYVMEGGCPLHYLFLNDYNHPSMRGSYLTACVIYSTIFQESSENLNYYAGIPENEAKNFQTIASATVLENLELWKIITSTIGMDEYYLPQGLKVYQNYPNPFNGYTTINYELKESDAVTLSVYDSLGRKILLLNEGLKLPGEHIIQFNASGLASGIYFYRLNSGSKALTKAMLLLK